ncbi:RDD family protein [Virgibacillus xinjiangensis]|uniref:RDD family protein n=1 Tax=Virgibacillus xinjiangensis TaxID=393090 RepID=A0ABV7CQT5_9BACI
MTEIENPAAEPAAVTRNYAGFWMRFWAYLVDLLIVAAVNGILLSPLTVFSDAGSAEIGYWTLAGILGSIVFYLYFLLMTKYFRQTLGKMIFGLEVIHEDGGNLRWKDLLFREVVGRFLHRVFGILVLLYLVVAFTPEKQGIHDMIGDTRVVHAK